MPLPSQCFVPGSRSCCCKAFSAGWNLVAALSRTGGRLHCPALLQSRLLVWGASINSSETTYICWPQLSSTLGSKSNRGYPIDQYKFAIRGRAGKVKPVGTKSQLLAFVISPQSLFSVPSPSPVLNFEPTLRYCVQMSKCQKQVKCTMFPSQLDKVLPRAKMNI